MLEMTTLGKTGLRVSRIGLGLAALGRPGYINLGHASDLGGDLTVDSLKGRAHAVLDAAWQAGVRYFDVARSYGLAEVFLASWLMSRHIDAQAATVASKWGYTYTADWQVKADKHEIKEHSLETLTHQLAESQATLGHHLSLYQIHSATLESGVLEDRAVLEELARLRQRGVRIGLSLTGPRQSDTLRRALDITVAGQRLFDCVQATWNLLEQSAGTALNEAHEAGLGVIVKEVLANGRLTSRNDHPAFANKKQRLEMAAAQRGTTADALALAAVLARPWADVVLSGAASVDQLLSNLSAQEVRGDDEELLSSFRESTEDYWSTRARLPWN